MIDSVFKHMFKQSNGVKLNDDYILFKKPLELWNMKTDESTTYKTLEDIPQWCKDIISKSDLHIFDLHLDGGSGSGSPSKTFKFSHASGDGEDKTWSDFPARMNTKIKTKTPEAALKAFRTSHVNDSYESGMTVDKDGFVTSYKHGNASSISISGNKGEMVYHNHPSGGAFSDSDLISTAMTPAKGVVASGSKGDYVFSKSTHFKANDFTKGVKNAKMKGKDYDDAVNKWLKKNQSKYGYVYSFNKSK